jgi:hypothetical protein
MADHICFSVNVDRKPYCYFSQSLLFSSEVTQFQFSPYLYICNYESHKTGRSIVRWRIGDNPQVVDTFR